MKQVSAKRLTRVQLGSSGQKVSRIGLGVWQASNDWRGDDEQVIRAIERSHELGVNLLDTAEAYGQGHSEGVVGRALKAIGREHFIVATKVYGPHLRYEDLQRACAFSLRRLGVREIDVYQVHLAGPLGANTS